MRIGAVFPQTEFGNDPGALRDYAQTVEALGYTHILAYDHVLGANPERPGGWKGPYTHHTPFHEPFVLFGFMAAVTRTLEFTTGVLVLPQRQTALVAKQAATLDVLSGGRLRLGVGIGWNAVEYTSLGTNFHDRGKRSEEQIALLRRLWTEPLINFTSPWHTIPDAGLNPLPVQRPIPLWIGGHVDAVLDRAARLADGWLAGGGTAETMLPVLERLDAALAAAGRTRPAFGVEARLNHAPPAQLVLQAAAWASAGATHLSLVTMGQHFTPAEHIAALRAFAEHGGLTVS